MMSTKIFKFNLFITLLVVSLFLFSCATKQVDIPKEQLTVTKSRHFVIYIPATSEERRDIKSLKEKDKGLLMAHKTFLLHKLIAANLPGFETELRRDYRHGVYEYVKGKGVQRSIPGQRLITVNIKPLTSTSKIYDSILLKADEDEKNNNKYLTITYLTTQYINTDIKKITKESYVKAYIKIDSIEFLGNKWKVSFTCPEKFEGKIGKAVGDFIGISKINLSWSLNSIKENIYSFCENLENSEFYRRGDEIRVKQKKNPARHLLGNY